MMLIDVDATVQKCMGTAAMENAKTFQLVLNTLNAKKRVQIARFPSFKGCLDNALRAESCTWVQRLRTYIVPSKLPNV